MAGASILKHPTNFGKGVALKDAFSHVKDYDIKRLRDAVSCVLQKNMVFSNYNYIYYCNSDDC